MAPASVVLAGQGVLRDSLATVVLAVAPAWVAVLAAPEDPVAQGGLAVSAAARAVVEDPAAEEPAAAPVDAAVPEGSTGREDPDPRAARVAVPALATGAAPGATGSTVRSR